MLDLKNPPVARLFWPMATAGIVLAMVAATLLATGGHPTYLLDDAWIHLQFSEQIVRGHFGLVPGEKASPSSSILYPLLLTPLSGTALHQWLPALWNFAALLAITWLWQRLFERFVFDGIEGRRRWLASGLLALALIVFTKTLWLALSGMEHGLQIAATLAVAVGLVELLQRGRLNWWLVAGLVTGPLLRLENLSITLPALCVLAWNKHWRVAALGLVGSVGGIVAHGLISQAADLPFFGGPVLLKGLIDDFVQSPRETLLWHAEIMLRSLRSGRADNGSLLLLALLFAALVWQWRRDRTACWLAAIAIASLTGQFVLGGMTYPGRYEIYSQCFALATLAFAAREPLRLAILGIGAGGSAVCASLFLIALFPAAFIWTATSPWAAQDIWRQHWQMRRFLMEKVQAPAAVNDVGLTAYRNPHMVLDLVGLGSEEVRAARAAGRADRDFYAALLARHRIEAVLIYDSWLASSMPATLERVAEFRLERQQVVAADAVVGVYATNAQAAARLRQAAIEFAPSMPPGSRLVILP